MPDWNLKYWETIRTAFEKITENLHQRVNEVADGRITPALEDIKIGSGRKLDATVLFFDIRNFTSRVNSSDMAKLKETLFMLNCVIPTVMKIIYDYNGYIEKNTGDGLMAIIGVEDDTSTSVNNVLSASTTIFYTLKNLINPYLESVGIEKVDARIGIDTGRILITRIGLPQGTSKHQRNFLTVVGPTANIASKIQNMAGTNQIWTGDLIKRNAKEWRSGFFKKVTPSDWTWQYTSNGSRYDIWHYHASRTKPE